MSPSSRRSDRSRRERAASRAAGQPRGSRRWWIGAAILGIGSAIAVTIILRWRPAPAVQRTSDQNVLLVTIDTLRADALEAYGGAAATPNLDALARSGWRFDFAHAHAVVTLPSHASILTGLYPFQHGIRDNSGYRLSATTPTLAEWLKQRGFATGAFVGAAVLDGQFGLARGFDLYDDRLGESTGPADFTMVERRADAVVSQAIAWLRAQRGRWFAWVHLFDPHAGYEAPPPYDSQYRANPYHGEVAFTDASLGPLFDAIRATAARPTLVVVTSDHGEALGDHGELTHGLFAYEATLRVPLIIAQVGGELNIRLRSSVSGLPSEDGRRKTEDGVTVRGSGAGWPSWVDGAQRQPPLSPGTGERVRVRGNGHVVSAPVQHVDLLPTIVDALGAAPLAGLPGRSLLDIATQPDAGTRASYFEALSASLNRDWAPLTGVLVGREKFIHLPLPELYDLAQDPAEARNLADRHTDRRRVLEVRLRDFGASQAAERRGESAQVTEQLRALGYLTGTAPRKESYTEEDDPKRLVDLDGLIHQGIDLFQRGRPREAIDVYRLVLARRPDMELAYRHLAFVHWMAGDVPEAIAVLRSALKARATSEALRTQLGNYLAETGAAEETIRLLEPSAKASGASADLLNALGIAYARIGRADEALAVFERVLAVDTDSAMAIENIGAVYLRRGNLAEARAAFDRALTVAPRSARAHAGLAAVQYKIGDIDGAIASWARAVELDPSNYDALFNLATALVDRGRLETARPYLEQFVRTAPRAFYARDIDRLARLLASR